MLSLGAAWTMTSLTDNPVLVSMVRAMSSLPFLLFAIPLGIAADAVGHHAAGDRAADLDAGGDRRARPRGLARWRRSPGKWLLAAVFLVGIGVVVQQSSWKPFLYELVPKTKWSMLFRSIR